VVGDIIYTYIGSFHYKPLKHQVATSSSTSSTIMIINRVQQTNFHYLFHSIQTIKVETIFLNGFNVKL
jgi:hypothetical protein